MDLRSLQESVGRWHEHAFGSLGVPTKVKKKFLEEAGEFQDRATIEEAADCAICLLAWAHRSGKDLESAIERKLEKLWERNQLERDLERGIFTQEELGI